MNLFDMRTVVVTSAVILAVCTLLLVMLWKQNRKRFPGIGFWSMGFSTIAVGLCLIPLRGLAPELISIVLSNVLIMTGVLLNVLATDRFLGRRGTHALNYAMLGLFSLLFAWFTFVQANLPARTLLISAMMVFYCGQCARLLLFRVGPEMRRWTLSTGLIYIAYAAIDVVRFLRIAADFQMPWAEFFQPNDFQTIVVFVYQLLAILLTYSLTLMVNQRLLLDVQSQEAKFSSAFRCSPYALALTRLSDGMIFEVNDGFMNFSGYSYGETVGKRLPELDLWANESDRASFIEALSKDGRVRDAEYPFRMRSGETILGLLSADVLVVDNEKCILSSVSDITERRRMEEALRESEEKFRYMAEHSSDTIWHMDTEYRFTYVSSADERMRGFRQDEVVGTTVWSLLKPEGIEHVRRLNAQYAATRRGGSVTGAMRFELELIRKDGGWIWTEVNVVPHRDRNGKLVGYHGVTRDISERKRAAERIEHMARHDTLTDLPNRALFSDRLDVALSLSKRNGTRLALMFVDLDKFKPVNDTFGHAMGDILLREAARRMRGCIRASDTVGRIGGDEFVVLLPVVETPNDAIVVAEKLCAALVRPFEIDGHRIEVSCSVGIAIAPDDGRDEIELAKNADSAMYLAKQQGGNAVRLFRSAGE